MTNHSADGSASLPGSGSSSPHSFNLLTVYDGAGNAELGLRLTADAVHLTATVVEGRASYSKLRRHEGEGGSDKERRRTVKAKFDVSLLDRHWHRLAFSFEVGWLFFLLFFWSSLL